MCVETSKPRGSKPQRGDRYVADNTKYMTKLPTNDLATDYSNTLLIPTTNRENGPPHWVRRKKQKRPSKFIVLDSRNQGTKQLSHFYNCVWTAYTLPPRVDPESSERLNQLGFYRAVIFILTPPFKAALYYTTLLENGQHWRSDLSNIELLSCPM